MAPTGHTSASSSFRGRLLAGDLVLGSFIKTPTGHATEIFGDIGFDFVVADQEHAPFGRPEIDTVLLAAKAADIAGLVRVPSSNPTEILQALDCGASGVMVPHIVNRADAEATVAACRYRDGRRGFSNSPRGGRYGGLGLWDHVDAADARATVIAMIEDPEAVDAIDSIVNVEGLDCVFIGRGDLTVALGEASPASGRIEEATEAITKSARSAGKIVCAMTAGGDDAKWLQTLGVTAMIVASDQAFMRQAAAHSLQEFRALDHASANSQEG
ncbi:MAG: aldolase [Hyphomicrobiales bacterium]|nr:aldolase [Hyphomicrobiales bacterium]